MKAGNLYRLTRTVEYEHQDHAFIYPAGLLLRLDGQFDDEDGPRYCFEVVYDDGMCSVFAAEDVEEVQEGSDNGLRVTIEPIKETITRLDPPHHTPAPVSTIEGDIPF